MEKSSQTKEILRVLKKNKKGTPNWRLSHISLKYSSRISEARKDGHNIVAERVWRDGHATGTWLYHLQEEVKPVRKFLGFRHRAN